MLKNKKIAVVVPAYNEELLISETLSGMPNFVDKIIVINDASQDKTIKILINIAMRNRKMIIIDHKENKGLGASLADGYLKSIDLKCDITAVMAGDNQMDPGDLKSVLSPILEGEADYVKGNRLFASDVAKVMPRHRLVGNAVATFLTKFATGYWGVLDPQCGYTAISRKALERINITTLKRGYGYNADILMRLNIYNFKVADVEVKPIYGRAKSGIKFFRYVIDVCWFLSKLFIKRLWQKYIIRDFHPLVFFYLMSFVNLFIVALPLTIRFIYLFVKYGSAPQTTLIILSFTATIGFFSFFFACWMDMETNKRYMVDINS